MILDKIVANKKQELKRVKEEISLQDLQAKISSVGPKRPFKEALKKEGISLIAEIKRASPSAGVICSDFNPVQIGRAYEGSGASAISVLTESRYFLGSLKFLGEIREAVTLPLLRKDFIFDPYQIYESKAYGADAILLIVSILSDQRMLQLLEVADDVELDAIVEVHTEEELKKVLTTKAQIIGINNRNLKTFEVDLATTARLAHIVFEDRNAKERIVVSESGIKTFEDVEFAAKAGADAVLVGEMLMRGGDIKEKVKQLLGK